MKTDLKLQWQRFSEPGRLASIAPYPNACSAALAMTFDDASLDHFDIAFPLLDQFHLKGTFFVLPGLTRESRESAFLAGSSAEKWGGVSWEELKKMSQAGHEIANHSWSHQKLTHLSDTDLKADLDQSYEMISKKIGVAPVSFAYPWNISDERVKAAAHQKHLFTRDEQHLALGAPGTDLKYFLDIIDHRILRGEKIIAMVHGIDKNELNPNRTFTVTENFFKEFLSELKNRADSLWVDTFENIETYQTKAQNTKLQIHSVSDKQMRLRFKNIRKNTHSKPSYFTIEIKHNFNRVLRSAEVSLASGEKMGLTEPKYKKNALYLNIPEACNELELIWNEMIG